MLGLSRRELTGHGSLRGLGFGSSDQIDLMPPFTKNLMFNVSRRLNANAIWNNGAPGVQAPDTQSVDAVGTFDHARTRLITDAQANVLRVERHGGLAEGERENLCTYSESLNPTGTDWAAITGVTVTDNDAIAPDGNMTADTLEDNSTDDPEGVRNTITIPADTLNYCLSIRIKKTTETQTVRPGIYHRISGGAATIFIGISLNTTTGEVTEITSGAVTWTSPVAFGVLDAGDYWIIYIVATNNSGTADGLTLSPSLTSDAAPSVYDWDVQVGTNTFWGVQLEVGDFPSSYIPTTTVAVTRAKDLLVHPAAGNIAVSSQPFSLIMGIRPGFDSTDTAATRTVLDTRNVANNYGIHIFRRVTPNWECLVRNATGAQARLNSSISFSRGDLVVLAVTIATNSMKMYDGGVLTETDVSGSAPSSHARIAIGADKDDNALFFGAIAPVWIYKGILSPREIMILTSAIRKQQGVR